MEAPPSPLSSRPERSVVERSAVSAVLPWERFSTERGVMQNDTSSAATVNGSAALPFVISTGAQRSGEICGVSGPPMGTVFYRAQGDAKRHQFSSYCQWKRRPPLCHLDRSAAEWRDLRCQRTFPGNVFRPEVMALRLTQGDEKWVLFINYCCWKRRPPLCHLDRSAAKWRDLRCQRSFPGNVFEPDKSWAKGPPKVIKNGSFSANTVAGSAALPFVILTGAQRSGEICGVSGPFLEMFFDRRSHGPKAHPR